MKSSFLVKQTWKEKSGKPMDLYCCPCWNQMLLRGVMGGERLGGGGASAPIYSSLSVGEGCFPKDSLLDFPIQDVTFQCQLGGSVSFCLWKE